MRNGRADPGSRIGTTGKGMGEIWRRFSEGDSECEIVGASWERKIFWTVSEGDILGASWDRFPEGDILDSFWEGF